MRIAFLLHSTLRSGGNLATLVLAKALVARGHDVEIFVQERFFPIDFAHVGFTPAPPARFLGEGPAPAGFDWAVTNWWECAYRLDELGARANAYLRHGQETPLYGERHFDLAIEALWREPGLAFFAVAPHLIEELAGFGAAASLVANGIDHDLFAGAAPSLPATAKLRVLVEGPLAAAHKRTRETLALLNAIPGLDVAHVAADGSAPLGPLSHAEFAGVMAACDVLVKLSSLEAAPMPVWEMAAAGKPSIVSDFPGAAWSVKHGETGLIVPLADGEGAARAAIERLRDDSGLRQRLGAAAKARAAGFTWEATAAAFEAGLQAARKSGPLRYLAARRASYEAILRLWVLEAQRKM